MLKDWLQTIFILFLTSICIALIQAGGQIQNIQENWGEYRCNPAVIPIAGYIAPGGSTMSTSENMSYCVQSLMTQFAPNILKPLTYLQGKTTSMVSNLTDSMYAAREQQVAEQKQASSSVGSVYSMFSNIIITFNIIVIKLVAAQGRTTAIMTTLMHILSTVKISFDSMWNGSVGDMVRALAT
jgi:hypothetical protein